MLPSASLASRPPVGPFFCESFKAGLFLAKFDLVHPLTTQQLNSKRHSEIVETAPLYPMEELSPPSSPTCRYPDSDDASSTVFLSLYEEEEARALHQPSKDCTATCAGSPSPRFHRARESRPTLYHVLRIFDSIVGFHKGTLDLTGRHPERYFELQGLWSEFVYGFLGLENQGVMTRPSSDGRPTRKPYNTLDTERWRRFQIRHKLPECLTYSNLLSHIQRVFREISKDPVPKFQRTSLLDLPTEVLDMIADATPLDGAKALACTCRKFNDVSQRYIFRTWRMHFHVPPQASTINVQYASIDLPTLAHYSGEDLRKSAKFVCATPHVASRIQRLVLVDEWLMNRRGYPDHNNPFILSPAFYKSITQHFASVCQAAANLSTLVLSNVLITLDICRMIADTPSLHTLELDMCSMGSVVETRAASTYYPFRQIINLHVSMDSNFPETYSQWYGLLFCPALRTLSIVESGVGPASDLDATFWDRLSLDKLERLSLDNIFRQHLSDFTAFFAQHPEATTHLTHFKLHMDWGFDDSDAQTLLLALESAPMDVLAFEGLAEADFSLFDQISAQYPFLQGLTLVRRHNASQHRNKLAVWPHASWEYASHFSGFKNLRHFCWNFLTGYWDATPSAVVAFENDFEPLSPATISTSTLFATSSPSIIKEQTYFDLTDEMPYFLDTHYMALPFAAHCPSLETFCIMDSAVDMVCRISRPKQTGAALLLPRYYHPTSSAVAWNVRQWNTVASRWPPLVQPSRGGYY
ncbi:hypothetical protein D9619_009773 [Psilocybe cf. subviscida]|uniref:F-box domain-containing protein n=1 Tax=Psilocybe cf. subviscida TaxID=2480587 RepID=A0A8H5F663_9AGAR|nr:hypothetical protein D9619_009773 [Psilocybe cf. subviscida]